ncbi:MAG: tetratricopeptide repeat protein [Bacteroidetes bacterium]|nr:tetratricopeptide repeat protein [Bacteroidota bacterium]
MAQEWHAQIDLANAELDKDHLTEALDLANGVIIKIQEGNTSSEIDQALFAKAQLVMVNVYLRQGRYEDALILIDKILHLAEEHKLLEAKAKSLHLSSKANFLLGAYERSLEYSTKALAAYEDIGDEPNQVNVIGNIGTIYLSLGSFDKALEFSAKALTIEEKNGNKSGVARLIANIGLIYIELESYEVALKYCKSALELHDELGEKSGVAAVTANIGLLYQAQGASQEAMEYMLKALAINEEIENKSEIALITMNIGCVCKELGNAEKSLEYFNRSLAIYEEIGAKSGIANVLGNMGIVFSNTNLDSYDDKKAEEYLLRAIEISKELGIQSFLIIFHKHLAELYKSENRWKEGYIQFEHYHEIEKEVQSEEANQKAIQLENRRKVDEAERDRQVKLARFQEQEKILLNILPA